MYTESGVYIPDPPRASLGERIWWWIGVAALCEVAVCIFVAVAWIVYWAMGH